MASIVRVILGVVVLVATFLAKNNTANALEERGSASVTIFGQELAPSSLNLILIVFAALGLALLVMGIRGALKKN